MSPQGAASYSRKRRLTQSAAERKLNQALSSLVSFGITFRRQKAEGSSVIDFVSDEAKLVIEIDANEQLDERQVRYNATRKAVLESRGCRFLRFSTQEVDRNLAQVMAVVMGALREQQLTTKPPASGSSPRGEGESP